VQQYLRFEALGGQRREIIILRRIAELIVVALQSLLACGEVFVDEVVRVEQGRPFIPCVHIDLVGQNDTPVGRSRFRIVVLAVERGQLVVYHGPEQTGFTDIEVELFAFAFRHLIFVAFFQRVVPFDEFVGFLDEVVNLVDTAVAVCPELFYVAVVVGKRPGVLETHLVTVIQRSIDTFRLHVHRDDGVRRETLTGEVVEAEAELAGVLEGSERLLFGYRVAVRVFVEITTCYASREEH